MNSPSDILNPGDIIDDKYEVEQKLGAGGMGEVYRVRHLHLLDARVIKVMRPTVAAEETEQRRFLSEARLATQIHHPNVAILFDFSRLADGSFYMVWEYIPGKNLFDVLKSCGCMPLSLVKEVGSQALQGLYALHRLDIIHRDISPENIMLYFTRRGKLQVKIIDLGIAKSFQAEEHLTQTGMFMGKLKYASPEQVGLLPDGEELDARTDLYSFGVVLYEMISGMAPFSATTPYGYIHKHTSQPPPPLTLSHPKTGIREELNQVIFKALAKDRNDRYRDAEEFRETLESLPDLPEGDPVVYFEPMGGEETLTAESTPTGGSRAVELESAPTRIVTTPSSSHPRQDSLMESAPTSLLTPSAPQPRTPPKKRRSPLLFIIPIVLLLALVGGYFLVKPKLTPTPPRQTTASPPAAASARLVINATPWAKITGIVDMATGEAVTVTQKTTPLSLALPPGTYRVRLTGPGSDQTYEGEVTLNEGKRIHFDHAFTHSYDAFLSSIR